MKLNKCLFKKNDELLEKYNKTDKVGNSVKKQ